MSLKDELRKKIDQIKQRAIQIKYLDGSSTDVIAASKEASKLIIKEAQAIEKLLNI